VLNLKRNGISTGGINMACSCNECANLSRTIRINSKGCYRYGCKKCKGGYICGWIAKDTELKTMGCSNFIENNKGAEQISLF